MGDRWLYDIFCEDPYGKFIVGNQGDGEFSTKEEAEADAEEHMAIMARFSSFSPTAFSAEFYRAAR